MKIDLLTFLPYIIVYDIIFKHKPKRHIIIYNITHICNPSITIIRMKDNNDTHMIEFYPYHFIYRRDYFKQFKHLRLKEYYNDFTYLRWSKTY